jgi:hypothetical protein
MCVIVGLTSATLPLPAIFRLRSGNGLPLQVGGRVGSAAGERHDMILHGNRDMGRSSGPSTGTGAVAGNRERLPATDVRQMKR